MRRFFTWLRTGCLLIGEGILYLFEGVSLLVGALLEPLPAPRKRRRRKLKHQSVEEALRSDYQKVEEDLKKVTVGMWEPVSKEDNDEL